MRSEHAARLVPLGLRVLDQAWADRVPSPAYDALTPAERRAWIADHPDSYLAVTQGPEDVPTAEHRGLLASARSTLDRLIDAGAFGPLRPAAYYVLRLEWQGLVHDAVVGGIPVADIISGGLRLHERVRPERALHLGRHLAEVGVQSSPLHVAHRPDDALRRIIGEATEAAALVSITAEDGLGQRVWEVPARLTSAVTELLDDVALYLIDGHHRTAAAVAHREAVGAGRADRVLAAVFDTDALDNRPHHRILDLGDDAATFLGRLAATRRVRVEPATGDADDPALGGRADDELALFHDGRWHLVEVPFTHDPCAPRTTRERLADLDPVRLQRAIDPLLGVTSGTDYDPRLRYRPGTEPIPALLAEATKDGSILALMRPVAVPDLLAAAEDGLVMPPKSTYFVPKARSGVFVRPVVDDA